MAKTFLRSGNLDTVLALGENGQPVWVSALQIRETLRLRRQTTLTNCLAIPQINERGDRLDWYSPFNGKVKSWLGASDHERRQALDQLTLNQQNLLALSHRARDADHPTMRLFGALLSKTLQFPNQQYVYLVDGKPVITFWGFVDSRARARDDALSCLRDTLQQTPPQLAEPVIATVKPLTVATVTVSGPDAETMAGESLPDQPPPQVQPAPVRRSSVLRPWPRLLTVALAAAAGTAYWLHPSSPSQPTMPLVATPSAPPTVLIQAKKLAETLPQTSASVTSSAAPQPVVPVDVVAEHTEPARANDLVMTAEDARIGSAKFINGIWRVTLQQTNLTTVKPPDLRYQLHNGKGTATIVQGDNIHCKASVTAAMTSAGTLVVRSRYTASCSDKSRYRMPELVCKAGNGAASCHAQYGANQVFPLTIKRESK